MSKRTIMGIGKRNDDEGGEGASGKTLRVSRKGSVAGVARSKGEEDGEGSLEGHFLIAMPGMRDERFQKSVVYVCAHSASGAMGFIINKAQPFSFASLLTQLDIVSDENEIRLPRKGQEVSVCMGGPVEKARGFVLHSSDYDSESTVPVSPDISLTPTLDILKAISRGIGPSTAMMVLGYSGWSPGQLESEIAANGWLTCEADVGIVFAPELDEKYNRALALLGVDPTFLNSEAGHA